MATTESTTKTFCDKNIQIKIRQIFEAYIDPNQILHVFGKYDERILSKRHKEEVQAETARKGPTGGADLLLDLLPHYKNWFRCLIKVLKDSEVQQNHVVEMMLRAVGLDELDMDETHSEVHEESSEKEELIHRVLKDGTDKSLMTSVMLFLAKSGDFKYMKEFIEKGANINQPDDDGKTVLMHVVEKSDYKDAIWILQKFTDVTDNDTCTALSYAASYGRDDCVEVLLNAGSHEQVNLPDKHGQTPLMLAAKCKKDNVLCLQKLLDKEADVNMRDSNGHTALAHAAGCGNVRCVEALLEVGNHENVNLPDRNDQTPLMLAARSTQDNGQCLQKLLSAGADIALKDSNGYTALFHAAESGNVDHIQALLNHGSQMHINTSINSGQTPLMLAAKCKKDNVLCLQKLLDKEADVNMRDSNGHTALAHAAGCGNVRCVEALLEVGNHENVNLQNMNGQTPLMLAARSTQDSTQCLQKLLSASADVAIKDSNGYTALFHAAESGNVAHIQALLYPSCYMHINASNNSGQTPLMLAARTAGDKVQCLEVLLSKGADVNKEDSDGKNALHHAKDAGNTKCVKLLQNVVACRQVNSPNISGQTAVSVGC